MADASVLDHVSRLMPFTTTYSVLATLAPGLAQQLMFSLGAPLRVPAAINFVCFLCLGVPGGSVLAYQAGLGVRGLWSGLVLAMLLIIAGQCVCRRQSFASSLACLPSSFLMLTDSPSPTQIPLCLSHDELRGGRPTGAGARCEGPGGHSGDRSI